MCISSKEHLSKINFVVIISVDAKVWIQNIDVSTKNLLL